MHVAARRSISSLAAALLYAGCGGAGTQKTTADLAAATTGILCADARADAWTLPIEKTSSSGALTVTLAASQAPVPVIGDSTTTWTLQLADATTGAPLQGAHVTALPYMPDHHHGTSVQATVTPTSTAGQYRIAPLYFFMAGYWTVTLTIAGDGGPPDSAVFSLCLAD